MTFEPSLSFNDVAWLLEGTQHAVTGVRCASLRALARLPLERELRMDLARRVDALIPGLQGAGEEAAAVLDAAPYLATPSVCHGLALLADRGPEPLRRDALAALSRTGDARAVPGLVAQLGSDDPWARSRAAESLAWLDKADARRALRAVATDADTEVRFWAVLGLRLAWPGGLEPLRAVLDDVGGGAPFPPLFGDPQVFLARLRPLRSWPEQKRSALASLADDARFTGAGRDLARLLRDAVAEAVTKPGGYDPERLQRAAAELDAFVGVLRRTSPPREATRAGRRDVIELLEMADAAPDPMAPLELGNRIVSLVDAIGPAFDADADAAARVYTEWEGNPTVLPQIAWVMARAGARPSLEALGRRVADAPDARTRERAARAAEDVARALRAQDPPIFGGGDMADVPPDPVDLAHRASPLSRTGHRSARGPTGAFPVPPPSGAAPPDSPPESALPSEETEPPGIAPPQPRGGLKPGVNRSGAPPAPPLGLDPDPPLPEEPATDTVQLGASAPRAAVPGDEFTARFVAYVKELEPDVRRLLRELAPRDVPVLGVQSAQWRRGTEVTVRLSARRLEVDPAVRTFVWDGARAIEDFQVFVPDDVRTGVATTLRFEVSILDVRVATITLPLEIAAERSAERTTADAAPTSAAFASYSSEDRSRVHDCLNALTAATSMDVFMDVIGLRAGQDWHERVTAEVGHRPLFLLFWSQSARASRWVDWEWREAFRLRGIDGIQPVPLDPAALAPPPPELKAEHFNSVHVLLRVADQTIREQRAAEPPPPAQ